VMPENVPFWKVESIGNDFVLVNAEDVTKLAPKNVDGFLARLANLACERRFGIGSDGLLVVSRTSSGLHLRMFNPDGTEDFCGNGLRCAARHGFAQGWVSGQFSIDHLGQRVEAEVVDDVIVRTVLGAAQYSPEKVPVKGNAELFNTTVWSGMVDGQPLSLFGSALTTGSTHVIIKTATLPDDDSFRSISAAIENDPMFPERTSVIWVKMERPMVLAVRIWERGAGETFGCGTGSAAAAADYLRRTGQGGSVTVINPGGDLSISAKAWNEPLTVQGSATTIYQGFYPTRDLL